MLVIGKLAKAVKVGRGTAACSANASAYRRDVAAHLFPKTGDLVLTAFQRKKL